MCSGLPLTVPHHFPALLAADGDAPVGSGDQRVIELVGDAGDDAQIRRGRASTRQCPATLAMASA